MKLTSNSQVQVFDNMDVDELSVAIWRGELSGGKALGKLACKELSSSCKVRLLQKST